MVCSLQLSQSMKTQIILLAALVTLSTKAFATEDYTKRIRCTPESAKVKVGQMADEENKEDFKAGLKAAGKKIRAEFIDMLNFQEKTSQVELSHVRNLIWKADCIMVIAMQNDIPNDVNAKYEQKLAVIEYQTEENLEKLPSELSPEELKVFAANSIMKNNRGPIAFTMALFE